MLCDVDKVTLALRTSISHHKDLKICVSHHVRSALPAILWLCCHLPCWICVVYHVGSVLSTMLDLCCPPCCIHRAYHVEFVPAAGHTGSVPLLRADLYYNVGSVLSAMLGLCYPLCWNYSTWHIPCVLVNGEGRVYSLLLGYTALLSFLCIYKAWHHV